MASGSRKAHVLVVPNPAAGHVTPLMKFAHKMADRGVRVTVVNSQSVHSKLMANASNRAKEQRLVRLVGILDAAGDDNGEKFMAGELKKLIEKINLEAEEDHEFPVITCVVSDGTTTWALEVAAEMGIKRAVMSPAAMANHCLLLQVPMLIQSGVLDANGLPLKNDPPITLPDQGELPSWEPDQLPWHHPDLEIKKYIFTQYALKTTTAVPQCDWLLTNTFHELEPSACQLLPAALPIGPLLDDPARFHGNFYTPEDPTCLDWLDDQPAGSVVYVAFGSTAVFSRRQFHELALGLELSTAPFLWVVRSNDVVSASEVKGKEKEKEKEKPPCCFPDGFLGRVAGRGKIVEWAPQERVLSHPSVACFFSHCGWNSTMEGVSNGVPFLCWPYFGDQRYNKKYICETWGVGLGLEADGNDEDGIVTREEIGRKIKRLVCDCDGIRGKVSKLKEMARKSCTQGGSSFVNLDSFVQQLLLHCH